MAALVVLWAAHLQWYVGCGEQTLIHAAKVRHHDCAQSLRQHRSISLSLVEAEVAQAEGGEHQLTGQRGDQPPWAVIL